LEVPTVALALADELSVLTELPSTPGWNDPVTPPGQAETVRLTGRNPLVGETVIEAVR